LLTDTAGEEYWQMLLIVELAIRLSLAVLLGFVPGVVLFAKGSPGRGSRFYPDPDRWDYGALLVVYAILDANLGPNAPRSVRLFVRFVSFIVLLAILVGCCGIPLGI
jgi:hypothetical protein